MRGAGYNPRPSLLLEVVDCWTSPVTTEAAVTLPAH